MRKIKYLLFALPVLAAMMGSCKEETIETGNKINEGIYETIKENKAFLRDTKSFKTSAIAEFYIDQTDYMTSVQVGLQKSSDRSVSGTVSIDEAWLEIYNEKNGTKYELLPADRVTIADEGAFTIAAGSLTSSPVAVTLAAPAQIDESGTFYALPLAIDVTGASTSGDDKHVVYLVRDQRALSNCIKVDDQGNRLPQSIVMFDGGRNPLNALAFELENGKLLWDIIVPFSSNLEWNQEEGRPYLAHNPELQWAYDNFETVIAPLQKRGMKVILSILNGNGSIAGVAQLSELGAKTFAAEVARFVYAKNLDGVFLDNEYEASPIPSYPYLASSKSAFNCARLYHELKKAMPDKLMMSYEYSLTAVSGLQSAYKATTGVDVSEYIDIVCSDYGGRGTPPAGSGLEKKDCTYFAIELTPDINRGGNLDQAKGRGTLADGYGYWMAFNLYPPYYYDTQASGYSNRGQLTVRMPKNSGIKAMYGADYKDPEVFYNKMDLTPYPMSEIKNFK